MFTLITDILDSVMWKRVIDERLERYGRRSGRKLTALEVRIQRNAIRKSN